MRNDQTPTRQEARPTNCRCRREYFSEAGYWVWSCLAHWWMCPCSCHKGGA